MGEAPCLTVAKVGIVSRDYRHRYENGFRDFSHMLPRVLALLDEKGCDTVLFSLFSIIARSPFRFSIHTRHLRHIKSVLYEEFTDGSKRKVKRFVVFCRSADRWKEYPLEQRFGSLKDKKEAEILDFVDKELPQRILGNCCILLCGESNGVKYSRSDKSVHDVFGLRRAIPKQASIILNPIHDRMTRFEMAKKREFLSRNGRWVISVWNKGKEGKNGKTRDGRLPAWTVFHNGVAKEIESIPNRLGLEIGILDVAES